MVYKETVLQGAEHPGTALQVMHSRAGFYLGFKNQDGTPYSRESLYFQDKTSADEVLRMFR